MDVIKVTMQNKSTYTAKCGCKVVEGSLINVCFDLEKLQWRLKYYKGAKIISLVPHLEEAINSHIQTALTEKQ